MPVILSSAVPLMRLTLESECPAYPDNMGASLSILTIDDLELHDWLLDSDDSSYNVDITLTGMAVANPSEPSMGNYCDFG